MQIIELFTSCKEFNYLFYANNLTIYFMKRFKLFTLCKELNYFLYAKN